MRPEAPGQARAAPLLGSGSWLARVLRCGERRPLVFVLALFVLLYVPWLASAPISGTIESSRLMAARNMLQGGDWVVPRLHGEPYLAKPPLQYWLIALFSAPFGDVSLVSARLLSALSVVLSCALVTVWGRREGTPRTGLCAGILLGFCGVLLEKGVIAELEALLALTLTGALFSLWLGLNCERRAPALAWFLGAGVFLGGAVLTKGPVPLIPFVLGAAALAATRRPRRTVLAAAGGALVLALLLASPWLLLLRERVGTERVLEVFGGEIFHRLRSPGTSNREPFWFYLPATLAALFPAGVLLPAAACVRMPAADSDARRRSFVALLATWALGTTLILSLSSGKEVRYLIPALPAWALLIALGLEPAAGVRWFRRYTGVLVRIGLVLAWLVPPGLLVAGRIMDQLPVMGAAAALWGSGVLVARRAGTPSALAALFLVTAGLKVAWSPGFLRHRTQERPLRALGAGIAEHIDAHTPLHWMGNYESTIDFVVGRPVVLVEGPPDTLEPDAEAPQFLLVGPPATFDDPGERWQALDAWTLGGRRYELWRRSARTP